MADVSDGINCRNRAHSHVIAVTSPLSRLSCDVCNVPHPTRYAVDLMLLHKVAATRKDPQTKRMDCSLEEYHWHMYRPS